MEPVDQNPSNPRSVIERARRSPVALPPKVNVVLLYGGRSAEHDVSRVSALNILGALDRSRYEVVPIGIGRDGTWMRAELAESKPSGTLPESTEHGPAASGLPVDGPAVDELALLGESNSNEVPVVVIPVLHGPNGEDGTVQGLLELANVAYVGSRVLGSAVAMDKVMAKTVLAAAGIPQSQFRSASEWEITEELLDEIAEDLGFPIFVKPANMGSSVGVSKASTPAELVAAVDAALAHDELIVFEEAVVGRELEIAVLGNEHLRISVPGEIIPAAEFYDFDDKYRDGAAETIVPADMPAGAADEMADLAARAYRALRAEGLARVDMFYDEGGRGFLVNEINTFPGFTPISMFPMLWSASGLTYSELLDEMIRLALDLHDRRRRS